MAFFFISVPGLYSGQEETEFNWMARHTIPPPLGTIQEGGGQDGGTMKKANKDFWKWGGGVGCRKNVARQGN